MEGIGDNELAVVAALILQADPAQVAAEGRDAMAEATRAMRTEAERGGKTVGAAQATSQAEEFSKRFKALTAENARKIQRQEQELLKASLRQRNTVLASSLQKDVLATREASQKRIEAEKASYRQGDIAEREAASRRLNNEKRASSSVLISQRKAATSAYVQEQAAERRRNDALKSGQAQELQTLRHADNQAEIETRASGQRRTALVQSFLRAGNNAFETGLRGSLAVVRSHLNRRETAEKASYRESTNVIDSSLNRQTSEIRSQLEQQGTAYTKAARRRLEQIERSSSSETRIIKESAVRQSRARSEIESRTSSGLVGAAAGRSRIGGGLQNLLALAGGGLIARDIAAEATESIKTSRLTAAGIKSTGGAANVTANQVGNLANRLSLLAGIDDEVIQGGENILLTFTQIRNSKAGRIFDAASSAALNLSVRFNKDLASSAILVGKALQDPIKGIGALRRVGVQLTTQQEDQVKVFVKGGKIIEAQKIILRELSKETAGSARAVATAGDRFKVFVKNIEESIGLALYPIVTKVLNFTVTNLSKLFNGKGAWKIIRDGLEGVAIGLGAILIVKGAVEVLGLAGQALAVLASSPTLIAVTAFASLAGVAFALARNSDGVRRFFTSLHDGSVLAFKVGFNLGKPIEGLSTIVRIQSSLGAGARKIKDFFQSLYDGSVLAFKVGYNLGRPIEGLSKIVLLQTTVGAAIRGIVNSFGSLKAAFKEFTSGKVDAGFKILDGVFDYLGSIVSPLSAAITSTLHDALSVAVRGIGGFARGLITGSTGSGSFLGSIADSLVPEGAAQKVGQRAGVRLHAIGSTLQHVISDFFGGLFHGSSKVDLLGKLDFGGGKESASRRIGGKIHEVAVAALSAAGGALGALGSGISKVFTEKVLPKLIELPRILGRFLSRTLFSKQFLTTVIAGAAGLAALAAVIAVQFLRGFAEGIIQRRGDIAHVIHEVLTFAVKSLFGSGNPFVLIGGLLVAGFLGAKVIGGFSTLFGKFTELRTNVKAASLAMKGDIEGARAKIAELAPEARIAGRGVGAALPQIGKQFGDLTGKARQATTGIRSAFADLGPSITLLGEKIGPNGLGLSVQLVGEKLTGSFTRIKAGASSAFDTLRLKALYAFDKVKANATTILQGGLQAATGAVSGYFAGMADDIGSKSAAILTSAGNIALAFSTGGPIIGALTAGATVVGYFFGQAQKASAKSRAQLAKDAAETAAIYSSIVEAARGASREVGGSDGVARAQVARGALVRLADEQSKSFDAASRKFGLTSDRLANSASFGNKAIATYARTLVNSRIAAAVAGNASALKDFAGASDDAFKSVSYLELQFSDPSFFGSETASAVGRLTSKLRENKIGIDEYRDSLIKAGVPQKDANKLYDIYVATLSKDIGSTSGAKFIKSLPPALREAIRAQKEFNSLQADQARKAEDNGPIATKFENAYGRIKETIGKATQAYKDFLDAQSGRKVTGAQTQLDLIDAAKQARDLNKDGLSESEKLQRQVLVENTRAGLGDQIGNLANNSSSVKDLQRQLDLFFLDLERKSPDLKTFYEEIRNGIGPDALTTAFDSRDKLADQDALIQKVRALFEVSNRPLKIQLDKETDPQARLLLIQADLDKLSKTNPDIQVYLQKHPGYKKHLDEILGDIAPLKQGVDVKVNLKLGTVADALKSLGPASPGALNAERLGGARANGGPVKRGVPYLVGEHRAELFVPNQNGTILPEVPTHASSFGESNRSDGPRIHHETNADITVVESPRPRETAAEVARRIAEAEFLGGVPLLAHAYAGAQT